MQEKIITINLSCIFSFSKLAIGCLDTLWLYVKMSFDAFEAERSIFELLYQGHWHRHAQQTRSIRNSSDLSPAIYEGFLSINQWFMLLLHYCRSTLPATSAFISGNCALNRGDTPGESSETKLKLNIAKGKLHSCIGNSLQYGKDFFIFWERSFFENFLRICINCKVVNRSFFPLFFASRLV